MMITSDQSEKTIYPEKFSFSFAYLLIPVLKFCDNLST
jgi:hypothetical protein